MVYRYSRFISRPLSLLLVIPSILTPAVTLPVQAAPDEAPQPVVSENVREWSVGADGEVLWWATNCFADEFPGDGVTATLKRRVIRAGDDGNIVQSITGGEHCSTFLDQLASNDNVFSSAAVDGLYYFDESNSQILRVALNGPFTPQVVKTLTVNEWPARHLVEANDPQHPGDFIYWAAPGENKILRAHKTGSGDIETVANTGASPIDVLVVGNTVFYTDKTGVYQISINCATLPCSDSGQLLSPFGSSTFGYGLLYQQVSNPRFNLTGFRIYWVEAQSSGADTTYKINYRFCRDNVVCFVLPPENQVAPAPPNFYTGTTNWSIGDLLLADNNIYWTEAFHNLLSDADGQLQRKSTSAPDADPADTIATSQPNIDDRLFVARTELGSQLYFARLGTVDQGSGIFQLPLDAEAIHRDLQVSLPELAQGIMPLGNGDFFPLVADKTTYVRAYGHLRSGPNAPVVEARLFGTRNGVPLPGSPLQPANGTRSLVSGITDFGAERVSQRTQRDGGWDFLLPASWTAAGTVSLRIEVDPRHMLSDPNPNDNTSTLDVNFQSQPPMCVWTVPVRTHDPLPSVTDPNFWTMIGRFKQMWPVPDVWVYRDTDPVEELEVCTWGPFPYPCNGPYELTDDGGFTGISDNFKVLVSLWGRAELSFNPDECDDAGAPTDFMGMVSPDADTGGVVDYASTFSSESWVKLPAHEPNPIPAGWDQLREGASMAQALGANEGRGQLGCGTNALSTEYDANYPYADCQIEAPVGPVNRDDPMGFDVATRRPIPPEAADDFMSSSPNRWVSDYTWRGLFNEFAANAASVASSQAEAAAAGNSVFVSGAVDTAHNRGEIDTVLTLPTASVPPATRQALAVQRAAISSADATRFQLRLLDPSATVLLTRTLALVQPDGQNSQSHDALFSVLFAPPAGEVAKIELLANDTVIDTLSPGIHPPTASIQKPAAGDVIDNKLSIQWQASDPDTGDRLLFTVQYSHDNGASWHTLALNVPGTPDPNNTLTFNDLGSLHGSATNTALIRVLASDGYNTTIATSKAFTLKNRPPLPIILSPSAGQSFDGGETVSLQGTATDPEDGGLPENALRWRVDGASYGSGAIVDVNGLSSGAHTAALAVTDANSQTVTTTVSFTLTPLSVPLATEPTLDGTCNDDAYVQGSQLQLQPYGDGSQAAVHLLRTDNSLWVCFSGLMLGQSGSHAYVGVHADIDNSRDPLAQPTDAGFFVGEDGNSFTKAGDGAGGFDGEGPGGLQAVLFKEANAWSAELRIDKGMVGGWDHLMGLRAGHYALTQAGDDYVWPYRSQDSKPTTWSVVALGIQPSLSALNPLTATVLGPSFPLTVTGSGFITGTQVLWNGSTLPTTYLDSQHLKAQVDAAQIQSAAMISVTTRSPAPGNFDSNALSFVVEAQAPHIKSLSPDSAAEGASALTLTVNGSNFAQNAQVLWNGTPLATQFESVTQLKAKVTTAQLVNGRTVGIVVSNPQPDERDSSVVAFDVKTTTTALDQHIYLPALDR